MSGHDEYGQEYAQEIEDAEFLEDMAKSLENVKVRPKGNTAGEISAANASTRLFTEKGRRLREIAGRLRQT